MTDRRTVVRIAAAAVLVLPFVARAVLRRAVAADAVSVTRSLPHFDRIRLNGAFTTTIQAGASAQRIDISGPADTVGRVTTSVANGTLKVGMKPGLSAFSPKLTIALPVLRAFANDGAGPATIDGLRGGDIDLQLAGAGSIVARGVAGHETIALDGTGKIDASGVDARDVTVDNNGVGSVLVRASGQLVATVNGVGSIRYSGNPAQVTPKVNGIGQIGRQ